MEGRKGLNVIVQPMMMDMVKIQYVILVDSHLQSQN